MVNQGNHGLGIGWESSDVFRFDLGPSFKVKRWFTGFGDLSLWLIQICIGSPMRRSSLVIELLVLILHLYTYYLSLRHYFLYLNVI